MNFLAHCWLARQDEAHIAGAFLGDFVKGPIPSSYPPEVQSGIRLHRHIDSESNRMDEMRATYWRFGTQLRRVAPVLLDLVADHLLAVHWKAHGEGDLNEFTNYCYNVLSKFDMPSSAARFLERSVELDLWASYRDFDVILGIMRRILHRLKKNEHVAALSVIGRDIDVFYDDFRGYFPLIEERAAIWRANNAPSERNAYMAHEPGSS